MAFVLLYFFCSLAVALVGASRPLGFWGHFVASLLFTPVIGMLLVLAAGDSRRTLRAGRCSRCGQELISK